MGTFCAVSLALTSGRSHLSIRASDSTLTDAKRASAVNRPPVGLGLIWRFVIRARS